MGSYEMPVQLRWSDLDPNFHMRHSVYYDWGAMIRINFFYEHGLTTAFMQENFFGPIILREEAIFRKEIRPDDEIIITLKLSKSRKDYSRWSFRHEIKRKDGTLCAILTIDGAWLSMKKRKLFVPPAEVKDTYERMEKSGDFEWTG